MSADDLCKIFRHLQGRVNAREFKGKPAGTLLWSRGQIDRHFDQYGTPAFAARAHLLHDAGGWNNVPATDGNRYPCRDSFGQPLYPSADFPPESEVAYMVTDCEPRTPVRVEPVADEPVVADARSAPRPSTDQLRWHEPPRSMADAFAGESDADVTVEARP